MFNPNKRKIKKDSNICENCGKEVTEGIDTEELIDAMPELHDEFDNISRLQAKDKKKNKKQKLPKKRRPKTKQRRRVENRQPRKNLPMQRMQTTAVD